MTDEKRRNAKTRLSSVYGKCVSEETGYSFNNFLYADTDSIVIKKEPLFKKLLIRIKMCHHICLWCKYHKICEISWWKYGKDN